MQLPYNIPPSLVIFILVLLVLNIWREWYNAPVPGTSSTAVRSSYKPTDSCLTNGITSAIKRLTPHYAACMQQFGGIIADVLEIAPESYEEIPVLKGAADHDEDDVAYITGDLLENIQKKAE